METCRNSVLGLPIYTYLPTFLLVLKEEEEEEEEDVEEVKLYDFDWTVPPETIQTQAHTGDPTLVTII